MLMRGIKAFGRFWYQLIIGDDWRIAAVITTVLAFGAVAASQGWFDGEVLAMVTGVLVFVGFTGLLFWEYRQVSKP